MTRFPVVVFLCLLGLLSTMGPGGCGGTETGNPAGPGGGGDRNPAISLAEAICETLVFCFGVEAEFTKDDCTQAIADSETLGAAFGIQEEPLPDYAQVIEKFEKSEWRADEEAVEACADAIRGLECDPAVLAVEVESGFGNVEDMIPEEACSQVFSGS